MPVAVIVDFDGATLDHYDRAIAHAGMTPGGAGGPGCLFHWVRATPDGIQVTDVWESREQFEEFASSTILPAVAAVGLTTTPQIEVVDVHSYFTAG